MSRDRLKYRHECYPVRVLVDQMKMLVFSRFIRSISLAKFLLHHKWLLLYSIIA